MNRGNGHRRQDSRRLLSDGVVLMFVSIKGGSLRVHAKQRTT
jgi:hypothetical protein